MSILSPAVSLALAIASLVAWIALTVAAGVTAGAVHALLAVGTTLLVRWYALAH